MARDPERDNLGYTAKRVSRRLIHAHVPAYQDTDIGQCEEQRCGQEGLAVSRHVPLLPPTVDPALSVEGTLVPYTTRQSTSMPLPTAPLLLLDTLHYSFYRWPETQKLHALIRCGKL